MSTTTLSDDEVPLTLCVLRLQQEGRDGRAGRNCQGALPDRLRRRTLVDSPPTRRQDARRPDECVQIARTNVQLTN